MGYLGDTYSRVKQAARDTVEDPDVDHEGEPETQSYIGLGRDIKFSRTILSWYFCDCCASECEEEEHGGADELAQRGNDVYQMPCFSHNLGIERNKSPLTAFPVFTGLVPASKEISEARLLLTAVRSSKLLGECAVEHGTDLTTQPVAVSLIITSQRLDRRC